MFIATNFLPNNEFHLNSILGSDDHVSVCVANDSSDRRR